MAMIPTSPPFNFSTVRQHFINAAVGTFNTMSALFSNADAACFNLSYSGSKDRLSNFRGYNHDGLADTIHPSQVTGLAAYGGNLSVALSWNAASDNVAVTGYRIYHSGGAYIKTVTTLSTLITGLFADTWYDFNIKAQDAAGNLSLLYSNTASASTDALVCFVEGTLITLPNGKQIPIELLVPRQELLSAKINSLTDTNKLSDLYKWRSDDLKESRIIASILSIYDDIAQKTIVINDGILETTPYHTQLIQRLGIWQFVKMENVRVGDKLYNINKTLVNITKVFVNTEKRVIYPMTLYPSHTYFANGILTHNMKIEQ